MLRSSYRPHHALQRASAGGWVNPERNHALIGKERRDVSPPNKYRPRTTVTTRSSI
jgi:hypothetical protein